MKFNDKMYDCLKWVCIVAIPALNTFLLAVLPSVGVADSTIKVIVTVISAVATFIGTLIGISNATYLAEEKHDN